MTDPESSVRTLRKRALGPGMRHYRSWIRELPRRVSPTDIDFVLHNARTDRCFWIEFKSKNDDVLLGQRLLLSSLFERGDDVLVVEDPTSGTHTLEDSMPVETVLAVAWITSDPNAPLAWEDKTVGELRELCVRFMEERRPRAPVGDYAPPARVRQPEPRARRKPNRSA